MEANIKIGEKIRAARKEKGLTIKQLAEAVGVSEQAISQYEIGKRQPRIEQLTKISDYLDVSINELLRDEMPYNELAESQNEAHEISEYILSNPTIEKDSKVGRIVNGYKFQGLIHDLIRGLLKKKEEEKLWLILAIQGLLELDRKHKLTQHQLHSILFIIDSMRAALSTDDPEMVEHATNIIKLTLEKVGQEIRTDQKNKDNTNKGLIINDVGEVDDHDAQE